MSISAVYHGYVSSHLCRSRPASLQLTVEWCRSGAGFEREAMLVIAWRECLC
jgi:hypothetical protein